eukprot:TRINITY_DN36993_c0_g1_i1.p1 TRINITY_DN36993_c0_g1~~TRINITY_DN36993_c0_g1_i1.p1  ORF type:complete len:281 (-),score=50.55 TRINITY_DN36993_c0_g1_i1:903-1697(-)
MAFLQHVCSAPLTRAIRCRSISVPSAPARATHVDSHVLLGLSEVELQQLAMDMGQQKYRGKQLHHLLYKAKAKDIQAFSHLPQAFRNDLKEAGWRVGRSPIHQSVTAADGTVKILIQLEDNRLIETVGIPVEDDKGSIRLTACVSSQVGCPLRCSFCATGKGGYSRNLQRHEIIEQVLAIEELFKHRVTNVVFMGMGCANWAKNDDNFHSGGSKHHQEVGITQTPVHIGYQFTCSKPETPGNDCSKCKIVPIGCNYEGLQGLLP